MLRYVLFLLVALLTVGLGQSLQAQGESPYTTESFPPVRVAANVSDCLVTVESIGLPFAGFSILNPYQRTISQIGGTGFIITSDGYILASPGVVKDTKILKVTHQGKEYDATVEATDEFYDLALLKIDATGLPTVEWGNSDLVQRGLPVVVMGSPAGLEETMTYGFITNIRDFRIVGPRGYDGMLVLKGFVTDAALHSGVEAGPVFNPDSECIAVVARKVVSGGQQNIGYLIPSNLVRGISDQLISSGKVCHPWLGIFPYALYDRALALYMGIPINEIDPETGQLYDVVGVLVNAVAETSPAAEAGIVRGDLILRVDGKLIRTTEDLEAAILTKGCGEEISLVIVRNYELKYITLEIGNKQEDYGNIYVLGRQVSI